MKKLNWWFLTTWSIFLCSLVISSPTSAQISSDGTVPTSVNESGNVSEITGGAEAGNNLFHSFEEFSVPTGTEAFFNNATNITNIISRVTGGSVSNINGLIRANGSANLFLLNPNGIVFGSNAALNIGGSFYATTADSLLFEDDTSFSATNPQEPLLTVSVPIGLQIDSEAGSITNQSVIKDDNNEVVGLQVQPGKNLMLLGSNISLDRGHLTAPGGRVELGGLKEVGTVKLNGDGSLSFPQDVARADISLDNSAEVYVRADDDGSIAVNAQNLSLTKESNLLAGIKEGLGSAESRAGDIDINATGIVSLADGSEIFNTVGEEAIGMGGNINITAVSLFLTNETEVDTSTQETGEGEAGNIKFNATESIFVGNRSLLRADTSGLGNAGNIIIEAPEANVSFEGGATRVSTNVRTNGNGQGGDIFIKARKLSMTNTSQSDIPGALLRANTFGQGDAGNIVIRVDDSITFDGAYSGAESVVDATGIGQGGNIDIQARSLSLTNGAVLFANTFGQGNAGNIRVITTDSVILSGTAFYPALNYISSDNQQQEAGGFSSGFLTDTRISDQGVAARGQGGSIDVTTKNLSLSDGAVLSAISRTDFSGGDITVNAETLELIRGGQIITTAFGKGEAGEILINAGKINISGSDPTFAARLNSVTREFGEEQAELSIDPFSPDSGIFANTDPDSTGKAGDININVYESLETNGGNILSSSFQSSAGAISISAGKIRLRNDSNISSIVREGAGSGGNVKLAADSIVAFDDSDIVTFAQSGSGGDIILDTPVFFGENYQDSSSITNPLSLNGNNRVDLNANGDEVSGIITLPDVSFIQNNLTTLPQVFLNTNDLIASSCIARRNQQTGSFFITGNDSLPKPSEITTNSSYPTGSVQTIPSPNFDDNRPWQKGDPIIEPTGVYRLPNGELVMSRECS
jgi:filamentous hemagglutinin family protein